MWEVVERETYRLVITLSKAHDTPVQLDLGSLPLRHLLLPIVVIASLLLLLDRSSTVLAVGPGGE
jgi:hypothetical protein